MVAAGEAGGGGLGVVELTDFSSRPAQGVLARSGRLGSCRVRPLGQLSSAHMFSRCRGLPGPARPP